MGIAKEQKIAAQNKRRGGERRGPRRAGEGSKYKFTSDAVLELVALTLFLVSKGGALRWGLTRDGGALALGVYYGDDSATEYVRPSEPLNEACSEIVSAWLPDFEREYAEFRASVFAGHFEG